MDQDGRCIFPADLRAAYERLLFPLAVYQFVGGKVVTLLVSDGMCSFMDADRDVLVNHYDENMFGNVHPDDQGMRAQVGACFAEKEGPYDVVYRDRLPTHAEQRAHHRQISLDGRREPRGLPDVRGHHRVDERLGRHFQGNNQPAGTFPR